MFLTRKRAGKLGIEEKLESYTHKQIKKNEWAKSSIVHMEAAGADCSPGCGYVRLRKH